jgi:hypothetical protein
MKSGSTHRARASSVCPPYSKTPSQHSSQVFIHEAAPHPVKPRSSLRRGLRLCCAAFGLERVMSTLFSALFYQGSHSISHLSRSTRRSRRPWALTIHPEEGYLNSVEAVTDGP